jgi:hypothetical protein
MRMNETAAALVLALLMVPGEARAAAKRKASLERQQAEVRLSSLDERLERTAPPERAESAMALDLSRRYAEMARKLLGQNNVRGALAMADLAERGLARLEPKEEGQ